MFRRGTIGWMLAVLIASCGGSGSDSAGEPADPATASFETVITVCDVQGSLVDFRGEITNTDDVAWSFSIEVEAYDVEGVERSRSQDTVANVQPGATADFRTYGVVLTGISGVSPETCEITNVTVYAVE